MICTSATGFIDSRWVTVGHGPSHLAYHTHTYLTTCSQSTAFNTTNCPQDPPGIDQQLQPSGAMPHTMPPVPWQICAMPPEPGHVLHAPRAVGARH